MSKYQKYQQAKELKYCNHITEKENMNFKDGYKKKTVIYRPVECKII